jgi:hypothetical protein
MGRFENSIALAKASWRVLRENKQLALFPVLSSVGVVVLMLTFLLPIVVIARDGSGGFTPQPVMWVIAYAGYVAVTYVVVFFNAALVFAADRHLHGQTVSLGDALRGAAARSAVLLPWVVVTATVSVILRMIEERSGLIGRFVAAIAGLAWSLVTFLVLPILVIEGLGVRDAIRRSSELFKRTWGENVIANAGIGLLAMLAIIAGLVPVFVAGALGGGPLLFVALAAFGVWALAVSLVSTTLTGILQVALYRFATQGSVPGFSANELNGAFRERRAGLF